MINKLSEKTTEYLIKRTTIESDDYELYHYGLFVLLSEVFLLSFCLITGLVFKAILPSILFYATFFAIHRFAGGVHVKTEAHCLTLTLTAFALSIASFKLWSFIDCGILITLYIMCSVISILLSPAGTPQKPLSDKERVKFKKITALIALIGLLLTVLFILTDNRIFANAVFVALLLQTISIICGRLFNKRLKTQET